MADNDAEIAIGVNLDADGFRSEYQAILKDLEAQTKKVIKGTMDNLSGAASKDWGELPFSQMHDSTAGKRIATQAFLSSLSHDLQSQGIGPGSLGYQSALLNASYRVSTPDPWQRWHQMAASGYTQQADATHPETALGRTIETDYALMSQSWARQFITKTDNMYRGKPGQYIDFEKMRDYAVDAGLGRWIDPDKEHTADNFELIDDELEKIEDKSDSTKKVFNGWNDTLKSVLGTLTAIGSLAGIAKTFEIAYNASEKGTTQAATSLPRTRAFVGMGALDVLAAQNASQSVGLGKDAVYNEIVDLSNKREEYKLLGQGLDALFPSLSGTFDNLMSGDNPYETYKSILTELYGVLQGADDDTRAQALMLLDKQGLGAASYIIGSFLSNPTLAAEMGNDPTKLFSLLDNPYRSSYGRGEAMLPDLVQLNESIKASYQQMYEDWEDAFGIPFKTWWNNTLIKTVVPWFEAILKYVSPEEKKKRSEEKAYEWDSLVKVNPITKRYMEEHKRFYIAASNAAVSQDGNVSWDDFTLNKKLFTKAAKADKLKLDKLTTYDENKGVSGSEARGFWTGLQTAAKSTSYDWNNLSDREKAQADVFQSRAAVAVDFLNTTGFYRNLTDLDTNSLDTAIIRVVQEYLAEGNKDILESFLYNSYTKTEEWKQLLSLLEEYKDYLKDNPDKVSELKISLFNQYGGQLQADVQKVVNR